MVVFVALCVVFYFYKDQTPKQNVAFQKCPDDYPDTAAGSAEYLADFDKWTNNFYNTYPNANVSDWSKARVQFWVKNNCVAALQRYEEAKNGKVDPATIETINNSVRESLGR